MEALQSLGIDFISIAAYIVNFGLLYFIIAKFAVPPFLRLLDERAKNIESSIEEANRLKKEFQQKMDEINMEKQQTHAKMMKEMENLNKALERKKAELVDEMNNQKIKLLEEAQKDIDRRKSQLIKEAEQETLNTTMRVINYILQNKVPQDVVEGSVREAWKSYSK